jgi:phosphoribosylaminoimidazole-succinocarboxamide synthase
MITSLPLHSRGKVRDNYSVGTNRLLMVASDRISAFDVIMGEPIPGKGKLLTQMALFWFEQLKAICPNHLIRNDPQSLVVGEDPLSVVTESERAFVAGRSMLVKRLKPLPVEAVVRGYLVGSGWSEYQQTQTVCGLRLENGLKNAQRLPSPIFTPAAKAAVGEHDENISFETVIATIGEPLALQMREVSIKLYEAASRIAAAKGIIIADTKFEFGLDEHGTLTLMDEVLTPDSSRFWPVHDEFGGYDAAFAAGVNPPSYDKQFLRDWLESQVQQGLWDKTAPAPALPDDVIAATAAKYQEALEVLTA